MKSFEVCKSPVRPQRLVDVWLDAGREGREFSYLASAELGLQSGDLVRVRLRGRSMNGLVVGERELGSTELDGLQPVEALLQKAAVDPSWSRWLEQVALRCHLSSFRMLKAALPSRWLGQARSVGLAGGRKLWWVQCRDAADVEHPPTPRQQQLLDCLSEGGGGAWQKDLHAAGFRAGLLRPLEQSGRIERTQRRWDGETARTQEPLELPQSLKAEQAAAIEAYQALPEGAGLLLWGVTGSGKTEVYLQLAAD